jgi:predicted MFS family arabinose efflux permease
MPAPSVPAALRPVPNATLLLFLAASILTISTGLRQSFGLFLPPLAVQGMSAAAFSLALALQNIVWGVSQPFIGMLADRHGTRPVLIGSALIYAGGLVLMSGAYGALGLDLGAGLLVGIGIAGTGLGILMGPVSRAVPPERRSQAVGTVAAAGSLGSLVLAPFGQWLIAGYGWQAAALGFAIVAAAMVLVALAIRSEPQAIGVAASAGAADGLTLSQSLRAAATHRGYLAMTAAFFACGFQLMFITVHLPSYLASCGLPASTGAAAIGVIGLCNMVGTYIVGHLGAHYSQRRLLALVYLLRTAAIIAYLAVPVTVESTLAFAAAMGLLWLSVAPLVSGLVGRVFGLQHFGTLYGFVFLSHQVGSFLGAIMGGIVYDWTGGYGPAWIVLLPVGFIAFLLQWPMDDRPLAARAPAAALLQTETGGD